MANSKGMLEQLASQLKELSESLAIAEASELPAIAAKRVHKTITEAYDRIRTVLDDLDPIKQPSFVFDPSDPNIAGRIAGLTMIAQARKPLDTVERIYGSGVYALYYIGDFPGYEAVSRREHPIYVGKADPVEASSKTPVKQGDQLSKRLNEHRKNILKAATTLHLDDFEYRALVVQTGWQTAAEKYLIHLFKPIWNAEMKICYGFGKHGDDPGTRANSRSPWDTLHPGRDWAHRDANMKDARLERKILADIEEHLLRYPAMESVDQILKRFLDQMRSMSV